jgi:hypothetical protein
MMVAGKSVCQNCVAAIRARVSGEVNAAGTQVMAPPAPYSYSAGSTGSEYAYQPAVSTVADVEDLHAPPSAMGLLAGSGLGLVAGVICAFLYSKFIFLTHFNIAYIAIGVGIVIGYAVVFGSKTGRIYPGMTAGAISLFSLLLTRFMLLNEYASREIGQTVFLPMNSETISMAVQDTIPLRLDYHPHRSGDRIWDSK